MGTILFFLPRLSLACESVFYLNLKTFLEEEGVSVHFWGLEQDNADIVRQLDLTVFPWNLPELEPKRFELTIVPDSTCRLAVERHLQWNEFQAPNSHRLERLLEGAALYRDVLGAAIDIVNPSLVLLWNGEYASHLLLRDVLQDRGIRTEFLERGLIAGSLFVDPKGLAYNSAFCGGEGAFAEMPSREFDFAQLKANILSSSESWWEQPERQPLDRLRLQLGIPAGKKVIFFPGQVDADTSNFLFSPNFKNNLEAFRWLLSVVAEREDAYILGKHHPKAKSMPQNYRKQLNAAQGCWLEDVAIQDCLGLCDCVATVNSTVGVEAMFHEKPTLALGRSLLSGRNVYYELEESSNSRYIIDSWLHACDFDQKLKAFESFMRDLVSESLIAIDPGNIGASMRSINDLVSHLSVPSGEVAAQQENSKMIDVLAKTLRHLANPAERESHPNSVTNRIRRTIKSLKLRIH